MPESVHCKLVLSHALSLSDLGHLRIIQSRIAFYAGIAQISIHPVDLREVFASADRAHIHIQFLVPAVIAVGQGQVYSLVESHLHGAADQGADRLFVVVDRVLHILDLSAVGELPEPVFQILLLDWGDVLSHMAVEAVADVLAVRDILNDSVLLPELLYLQTAEILRRCGVDRIEVSVLMLKLLHLLVDML